MRILARGIVNSYTWLLSSQRQRDLPDTKMAGPIALDEGMVCQINFSISLSQTENRASCSVCKSTCKLHMARRDIAITLVYL
jgi:hypothetical protein